MASKRMVKIGLVAVVLVVFLLVVWAVVQFVLLPRVSTSWQTILLISTAALLSILGSLAAVAQITGYSLRDLRSGRITSTGFRDETHELIRAIRSELYGNDSRLPITLSQASELCDQPGLNEYRVWIRKELAGFNSYEQLEAELGSAEAAESWMHRWASHRLIATYFKVSFMNERGSRVIDELPYEQIFVAVPIQKVVEEIEGAKASGVDELYVQLVRLDRGRLSQLRSQFAEIAPGMEVPQDLRLFTRRAEYEGILFGVRDKVVELLIQASSRQPG